MFRPALFLVFVVAVGCASITSGDDADPIWQAVKLREAAAGRAARNCPLR